MKKLVFVALMAMTTSALANQPVPGTFVGKSLGDITAALTAMGYDVRKSEREHGKIEVYAVKGNARSEIYVDPVSGKITRIKAK